MKIVVGVDGSKFSQWALNWLKRIPFAIPASVTAVHAIDIAALRAPFVPQIPWVSNVQFQKVESQRLYKRGKIIQKDAARRLAALSGRAVVCPGRIVPTILRFAKPHGLVVVGHRGWNAVDRIMLGSTSDRIVRQAPCSVLVVKDSPHTIRRVVLAIDSSRPSHKGIHFLTTAIDPAARTHIEVIVSHVVPYPELQAAGRLLVRRAADKLEKAGYQVIEAARLGYAADEIIKLANRSHANLVIVGARGHSPVSRFFLGSVSARLLEHTNASLLIAR